MNIKRAYFSMEDLTKRGLSLRLTQSLYGEPDITVSAGIHQKQWRFFDKTKIYSIEKTREFKLARDVRVKKSNQRIVRNLSHQVKFAYNFCKHFQLKVNESGSATLISRALDLYDKVMMQKTGLRKPSGDRCWHHEIPSGEILEVILEYIKIRESNYLYGRNYIDMLRIELTTRGAEFRDYQKCVCILDKVSNKAILNKHPDILMYCDDIEFEKECERNSGHGDQDVDTLIYH